MNTKFEIARTKTCFVPATSAQDSLVKVEMSVVCKNGKYGLFYTPHPKECWQEQRRLLILPINYDNLLFEEVDGTSYLIAVVAGKQTLFKLEMMDTEDKDEVIACKLPMTCCDRIVISTNRRFFHLFNEGTESLFDLCDEIEFLKCDRIEQISKEFYRAYTGNKSVIWDTAYKVPLITIDENVLCKYVGAYNQGDVFKLTFCEDNDAIFDQLLFYEYRGYGAYLSPRAERITIRTKEGFCENRVVGIEMSWGDWESPIDTKEIIKEKIK